MSLRGCDRTSNASLSLSGDVVEFIISPPHQTPWIAADVSVTLLMRLDFVEDSTIVAELHSREYCF